MELRQLDHFVAVAEELHFTRAAARVHVVQSSLSASIRTLEHELGDALFVRGSRRVALTQAGRALLPVARRALAIADDARDAVAGVRGVLRGRLQLGAIQTLGVVDLAGVLARFHERHPQVVIGLTHAAAGDLAQAVVDAELDIAFVDGPIDRSRLIAHDLGHDHLVLAVPRSSALARRRWIRLSDPVLRDHDFVEYRADSALRAQVDTACASAGLARRVACEASTIAYLADLVARGMGAAILPPLAVRAVASDVAVVPITPPLRRDLYAVVASRQAPTAAVTALLELLQAAATACQS